ncbi:hypothetical protein [Streptomyces sp. RK9]|uniref:hypothetical protein n=1 Tax=Streptomyces sp. RK9 TaxID=3239284 RepID=UPI0038646DE0
MSTARPLFGICFQPPEVFQMCQILLFEVIAKTSSVVRSWWAVQFTFRTWLLHFTTALCWK